jgi:phage tail sheath gpL-like
LCFALFLLVFQPGLLNSTLPIVNNRVTIAPCALTLALDPGFVAGDAWRIAVIQEKQSDTLTIGSKTYTFVTNAPNQNQIRVGANTGATATNIAAAVNAIHPELTSPSVAGNKVNLQAKVAGSSGNNLELSTSNSVNIAVSRMQGGADQTTQYSIKDKVDQPKNSVI